MGMVQAAILSMPMTDKPLTSTTPEASQVASTPQSFVSPDYNFTLQIVFELQKSTGQLIEAVNSLKTSIERQHDKIDHIEEKLSGVTHKIYAAGVVLALALGLGGFIVNKAWDLMIRQLTTRPEITIPSQSNPPPIGHTTKKP